MNIFKQKKVKTYTLRENIKMLYPDAQTTVLPISDSRGNRLRPHIETPDFPLNDPWSLFMQNILRRLAQEGTFKKCTVIEIGVGDARQLLLAKLNGKASRIIGIDKDEKRVAAAARNLRGIKNTELLVGNVEDWLEDLPRKQKFNKTIFLVCVPQAPYFDDKSLVGGYDSKQLPKETLVWDKYGYSLNATILKGIVQKADLSVKMAIVLSDRIPTSIRNQMICDTGWKVIREYRTTTPIQQDPTTGVEYVQNFDDGERFYEYLDDGSLSFISAKEAETRRKLADGCRKGFNVYHYLSLYVLSPAIKKYNQPNTYIT